MKPTLSLAAVLLVASAGLAANHGVVALPGDRFTAEISPAGDADAFVVPLAPGSRLSVEVRAAPGSTLLPTLALRGPGGNAASLGTLVRGEGTARLALRNLHILDAGGWAVIVGGAGGTTGAYEVSFAAKTPTRFSKKGLVVPGGGTASVPFAAGDGAVLSFLVHGRGVQGKVSLRDPMGAEVPIPAGAVTVRGPRILGRGIRLSGPTGGWSLRISAPRDTVVDATLRVRSPRPRNLRGALGSEPRPTSFSPGTGRDGLPISVTGEGFDPGARVRFGETWATGASVTGETGISGTVPDGPESVLGLQVGVFVANPDGQENAAPGFFRYLGIPKPESVTPAFQPPEGGFPLVIAGRNFRPGFSVSIGGVPRPDAVLSPLGEILCTSPPHALGTAAVEVTDEFGRTGTLDAGLTYIGPPSPASASPASSSFTGGRTITLSGVDLRPGLLVFVDGVPCEGVAYLDPAHLRFRMPAGPAGTFDISVVDEFGRTATGPGIVRRRGPFVDASAAAVPSAPAGTDFFGHFAVLGDLDGDLVPDLLVGSPYPAYDTVNQVYLPPTRVFLNDGSGAFTDGTEARLGAFAYSFDSGQAAFALLGDLDDEEGNEVVLTDRYPESNSTYTFTRNGKTYSYAIMGYYGSTYPDQRTYGATRIFAGGAGERLEDATAARMAAFGSTPLAGFGERWQAEAGALGDLDGDGDLDMVLAAPGFLVRGTLSSTTYSGGVYYLLQSYAYAASTRVLRNDGDGVFSTRAGDMPAPTFMNGVYATRVAEEFDASAVSLGDLDGDGDLDLILARDYPKLVYHLDTQSGNYTIYYIPATRVLDNDGSGRFTWDQGAMPATHGSLNAGSYDFWQGTATALGDLDGDGDLDLVLGRPQAAYWYAAATSTYGLQPALRIFSNDGTGRFTEGTGAFLGPNPAVFLDARSVALGDLDGDESLDLVVTGQAYYVYAYSGAPYGPQGFLPAGERIATRILLNDGAGRLEDFTGKWLPSSANGDLFTSDAGVLGDLDGDGDLDLVLASDSYPASSATPPGTNNRPLRILKCE